MRSEDSPVRSRSRVSMSSRYWSVLLLMARSSSRSESYPVAMTPPSRSTTGGLSTTACNSSSLSSAKWRPAPPAERVSAARSSKGVVQLPSKVATAGMDSSALRRPAKSRGRAVPKAMRVRMRSTSPTPRKASSKESITPASSSSAIPSSRSSRGAVARNGRDNQRRNSRAPMGVAVASSTAASEPPSRPLVLSSSSRLRRVAGSSCTASSRFSTASPVRWGSAVFWVSCKYCSRAPAAVMANSMPVTPKPAKSRVLNWVVSRRSATSRSKCHGARGTRLPLQPSKASATPSCRPVKVASASETSSSTGCRRASSAASASVLSGSLTVKRPPARSTTARPASGAPGLRAPPRALPGIHSATTSVSRCASSRASSVTVPGVTTRTTARSTGPFDLAGSPICSQMATLSPLRTRRAR